MMKNIKAKVNEQTCTDKVRMNEGSVNVEASMNKESEKE